MKTLELSRATASLASYVRRARRTAVVVTRNGRPIAAVIGLEGADPEDVALATSVTFRRIIQRSRARLAAEGGVALPRIRRRSRKAGSSS